MLLSIPLPGRAADLLAGQSFALMRPAEGDAVLATVSAEGKPGGAETALRFTINKPTTPPWMILAGTTVPADVPEGRRLQLHFWGRSPTGNQVRAVVEKNGPPYNGVVEIVPTLTKEWKEYTATGTSPSFGPNGIGVKFQAGYAAGTVELAGIRLDDLGPDPAIEAATAAITPAAIEARIQKYRVGDLTVIVRDGGGKLVRNAAVTLHQTSSAFLFGSNFFNLDPANTADWQKDYQTRYTALLNFATLPFYWGSFEREQGKPQYDRLDAMAKWCLAHGVTPKGHPLVWHEVYPAWAPKDPDAAIPVLHQRVTDIVTHYRDTIHIWDIVNEANNAAAAAETGEGAWVKRDGPAAVVSTSLGWARQASGATKNTFIYNDFNTGDQNVALLKELQKKNSLPDAVGIQSHMHGGTWSMAQVWRTTERFSQFGKPVFYTEVTVLSGPRRTDDTMKNPPSDWLTTPEGEKAQANYVVQFYTLLFSHPAVRGITWWDFSDRGAWQNAPAGLVRKDMTPKPAYDRLMDLIHKQWSTDATGTSSAAGLFHSRAFYGDYQVTATDGAGRTATRTVHFPMDSKTMTVEMVVK